MRRTRSRLGWVALLLPSLMVIHACGTAEPQPFGPLKAALERARPPATLSRVITRDDWRRIRPFYAARDYRLVWTADGKITSAFNQAVALLERADEDALDPAAYDIEWLGSERDRLRGGLLPSTALENEDEIVQLELRATAALMRWATHVSLGRFNPARRGLWDPPEKREPLPEVLSAALENGRLRDLPGRLRPQHGQYHALLALRKQYADLASKGPWPRLTGNATVRPGGRHPIVPLLRKRLAASGDLAGRHVTTSARLDEPLADALRAFQARHGLPATGVLAAPTRAALNVPIEARLQQIDVNIERWRFAPRDLGARHVRVNIPDFYLALMDEGQVRLGMRVVVGEKDTPTPILSDEMRHIVFSPYWNIPDSIANGEMLPALMDDPDYLGRNNIELVRVSDGTAEPVDPDAVDWTVPLDESLRFRQKPGVTNALGLVKFVFPNHSSIYLHDTPADALFNKVTRALSHGCVRVERPVDLAHALLTAQGWEKERIEEAMHRMEEEWVRLADRIPVHLMYWTAWVDGSGHAQFRSDIYGHDAAQARALERAAANPRSKP